MIKLCFTGHRPSQLPWNYNELRDNCERFKRDMEQLIRYEIINGVSYFITGMALGIDMICAEIIIKLKKEFPHIKLEAAIPCPTQTIKWNYASKQRYAKILEGCDFKTVISNKYTEDCMLNRNKYMVDCSDKVLAVCSNIMSGTGNTIKYAQSKNKSVILVNPDDYKE